MHQALFFAGSGIVMVVSGVLGFFSPETYNPGGAAIWMVLIGIAVQLEKLLDK